MILNHLLQLAAGGGSSSQSPGAALPAGVSFNAARGDAASGQARAIALAEVDKLEKWLKSSPPTAETPQAAAHRAAAIAEIEQFRKAPSAFIPPPGIPVPPGQPIGDDEPDND